MERHQEINEINLIDLIFYCLKRWRWIVVCMVSLAIIAGIYRYQNTVADNELKKEKQLQMVAEEQIEEGSEVESIVLEDPVSAAISSAIIGMFGGVCFVCLLCCMNYLMSGKLQNLNNFQERYDIPLLGIIRKSKRKRKLLEIVDYWICRLEEGPYMKIGRDEQIKIAIANVQAVIRRNPENKLKKIMIVGTTMSNDVIEIYEQLVKELEEITFSPYKQIVFHASDLKELDLYDGVLFIEKKCESYEKLIKQEIKLALDRTVKVLGAIIC